MSDTANTDRSASHAHTNRLAQESSPYLLQHQHNPVDWQPWGSEAIEAARAQDKPIFLSVGYSTCYWCHVMERQCFEDERIAALMNERFINIKVDREERPDIDQLYMMAVQILTRHGGWPMSVWLTPDLRPFYGGTYFPPEDAHGRPGFPTVIRALYDHYRKDHDKVDQAAAQLVHILEQLAEPRPPERPITIDDELIADIVSASTSDYDAAYGGFGTAPKFPRQTLLELLLVRQRHFPDSRVQAMLRHTLDALGAGGIRDHLGGGFHRYSTDERWLVPHFEIMLYDNAMLAWCYVEAYRQTDDSRYAAIARGIFDFVLREMTSPEGTFYTAFDAETDAMEGASYLWTAAEVESVLGAEDAALFSRIYGLDRGPNFADPHHGAGQPERNVLFVAFAGEAWALRERLEPMRQKLYRARAARKQPLLDTKIITSWNALMIRALAHGGQMLKEERYLRAAAAAANHLRSSHRTEDGGLFRTSRDGRAKHRAFLDDYAFLCEALLVLHDAGAAGPWQEAAREVASAMRSRFYDEERGGFFFTEAGAPDIIIRQKTATDSPLPSGNGVAARVMLRLGEREVAQRTIEVFAAQMAGNGEGMSALVQAAMEYLRVEKPFTAAAEADRPGERPLAPEQLAAQIVDVRGVWEEATTSLRIAVTVARGYHVNAHNAGAGLVPTRLTPAHASLVESIEYPPGQLQQFAFTEAPVPVYEGSFVIGVRMRAKPGSGAFTLALTYQACDDNACLPPVTRRFDVPVV